MTQSESKGNLFVVGAGGHAKVVIEVARAAGWNVVAAFDPGSATDVLGVPVLGADGDIAPFWLTGAADAAVIAIGDNRLRHRLADKVRALGCPTPSILHPGAWISPSAVLADGIVVMAAAVINAAAVIGRDCIVNTGAIVEHDCVLGNAAHTAPRSVMGGGCRIGAGTLFGIGASARPGIEIGENAIIGAGTVVVCNIPDAVTMVGNPARRL